MKANNRVSQMEQQIARLKGKLVKLGPLHPGSLSRQYNVCGKPGCRCKDPKNPRRHGPYYKVSYVFQGRFTSRHASPGELKVVRAELANYKRLRKLVEEWVALALRLAPCAKSNCYPRVGIVVPKGCYPMAFVLFNHFLAPKRVKTSRGASCEP
jgi:hypothetical protein